MALTVGKTAATVGGSRAFGLGALRQRRHKILTQIHKDIAKGVKTNGAVHHYAGGRPLSLLAISRSKTRSLYSAPPPRAELVEAETGTLAIVPRNLLAHPPFMVGNAPALANRGSCCWGALLLTD